MEKSIVSLQHVDKKFGSNHVIKDLNLDVREGEFLTLLGPSGCGKTTILRLIAGFEVATSGGIFVEDERVEDKEPYERNVNTVFQNYALFPHMTVFENIAYGLTVKKVPKAEIRQRVTTMLELVQLSGFEERKPDMMSGGQKQRVAIARALINNPKVLLLDEPLGALDLKLRKQMQIELKRLQKKLNITFVYVTHDQEEALTMSDRIAVMRGGVLEQLDAPDLIYSRPRTKFVADFIGESNILCGTVSAQNGGWLEVELGYAAVPVLADGFRPGEAIALSVRPEVIELCAAPPEGFSVKAVVKDRIFIGSFYRTIVVLPDGAEAQVTRLNDHGAFKEGDEVYLTWAAEECVGMKDTEQGASSAKTGAFAEAAQR